MSVTFDRLHLIKHAKAALAEDAKAVKAHHQEIETFKRHHCRDQNNVAGQRKLRDYLTAQLRKNAVITRADVRKAMGVSDTELLFYTPPGDYEIRKGVDRPVGLLTGPQRTEINAMLKVLEAAKGETITANEMKLLGFKNLYPMFAAAAGEGAK